MSGNIVTDLWDRLRSAVRSKRLEQLEHTDNAPLLRAELFGADQMEQHGNALGCQHRLSQTRAPDRLLALLADNEVILLDACTLLTAAVTANRRISPAGEWLLDNFYLIEEQIRTARRHLPRGYSRELPRLAHGASAGLPRVYDIALEAISHGDGRVDPESLSRFVAAYQKIAVLNLGELWAIPIMLRIALIENLRRVGARVAASTLARERADAWADQMIEAAEKDPKSLILVVADMARSNPPMASSFVAELARRLQGQSIALALPLTWIEQRLSESQLTIEDLVQQETQRQASAQVSISNSIGSLRFLGAMDWREFVETMSGVEHKLREDPGGVYGRMDFATRDRYRHAVESIARSSAHSETEVARMAIRLAHEACARPPGAGGPPDAAADGGALARSAHVGYYLIDKGLAELKRTAGARLSPAEALRRAACRMPLPLYLGGIALLTLLAASALLTIAHAAGMRAAMLYLIALPVLLGASHLAVALANWIATLLTTPRPLPRLDFAGGIPPECRTLIVVPSMLTSAQNIADLLEALEVRFLANREDNLHFGLLTDFGDAGAAVLPGDEALLRLASDGIRALNEKYPGAQSGAGGDFFFLFQRPRLWNPQDRLWMDYERKRGKLADLNALLRGDGRDRFSAVVGSAEVLSSVKYVITLDTDTRLPRDSARQFAGAMAHPLNRPCFDERLQRVTEGYAILQPRVAESLPGASRSRYARLLGSEPGIDPYTRTISDVYQDVFGEASFIGKGIYDVDAFERSLKGRFPENRILSHDLLEGCYARAALMSDVQLYEEYPSRYDTDVNRRHRWIRGDWQIASWLLPRVPAGPESPRTGPRHNPLSALSQWKIFDNLRRSLVPAALLLLLLLGWTRLSPAWIWTLAVIGILVVPPLVVSALDFLRKPDEVLLRQHLAAASRGAGFHFAQALLALAFLPYEAWYSLDAVLRTNWRILVSHRRLLEWTPSGSPACGDDAGFADFLRRMWIGPAVSAAAAATLAAAAPAATIAIAFPVLLLWFASPAIAWWISRPVTRRYSRLSNDQVLFLQKISRRTWAFFERFVGPDDHWLPPDNFQEHPVAVIAHRTSPTNMGLALLSNLSAHDFGYLHAGRLLERTSNALQTMSALARHHGHFYNWYDTLTLRPLAPLYISSVDSGNLAGHLLTLKPGLLELHDRPIVGARLFEGLLDTAGVLAESAAKAATGTTAGALALLETLLRDLESAYDSRPATLRAVHGWLVRLSGSAAELASAMSATTGASADPDRLWWAQALERQCASALEELLLLAPWLALQPACGRIQEPAHGVAIPTLRELAAGGSTAQAPGDDPRHAGASPEERRWLDQMHRLHAESVRHATERMATIERLALQAGELAVMQYDFLYDRARHLLAIGYNVTDRRLDASFYDLLASEARLCCFVAIAQGQLPQESWFALSRLLATSGGEPTLLSWSGSMFEYLMPLLVMPTYENTLLDRTYQGAVGRQIAYGAQRGVAWGVSESGYNAVDADMNYQYRAFGVPGLGFKRGLAEDLVIAPYASALALMVEPELACANLQRLAEDGMQGQFGLYEAVDYTASRVPRGQSRAVIRSYMAHHQGMILLSLAYQILDRPMQRRFASEPMFQATALLLQERVPRGAALRLHSSEFAAIREPAAVAALPVRVLTNPDTPVPEVQLLSNGRYHVMVTNAGGGSSRWKDLALTRWREDATSDNWGTFCYIRDMVSGVFWSNTHQPTLKRAETAETLFSEGRAEFRRRDLDYDTHTVIVVSPEDDIELRRVQITNRSRTRRVIEVTSYAEVVLASAAADALHPAFSNLFVQTEIVHERHAILCSRRPRSLAEHTPCMFHQVAVRGADNAEISYETDRMRFIGRGRSAAAPLAMAEAAPLSGGSGSVLDPVVAIRHRITLEPEQTVTIDIVTGVGASREQALNLAGRYQDRNLSDRVFELAWTHSQVVLRQINATETDAQNFARLAGSIIYANPGLRADAGVLSRNRRGQSGLWGYAISGDLPIVLLQIGDIENVELVRQLVQAHAYWRLKGLTVDLVIWNEDHAGYRQLLQDQILSLVAAGIEAHVLDRPGGIFVRRAEQISEEDRILFLSVARIIISDSRGTLAEQIGKGTVAERRVARSAPPERRGFVDKRISRLVTQRGLRADVPAEIELPALDLLFHNGLGGFTPDGREYVITTAPGRVTPAPWVNVLANPHFGSVVSESGMAYTWSENAHEFRLTPWTNDAVTDASGEAFYLRDEESGHFWSPTPLPSRGTAPYVTRHGFGYSRFEHAERGIRSELTVYVDLVDAVKFSVLKVRNQSGRARRLTATGYVEWVLGDLPPKSAMHVITEIDPVTGALQARNAFNTDFARRIAFFDTDPGPRHVSGDRGEFLGRNGTLRHPAAMTRTRLSDKVGAALDPCAAIQLPFELADGEEREFVFRLGAARTLEDARALQKRSRGPAAARDALEKVHAFWRRTLDAVRIETPDRSLDMLANGWLVYQTLACRLWARSGFYQSGGAYGFRDQLQDVMALVHAEPALVREHLVRCAGHQFPEGDVLHWWHPTSARGVRTHCSDDFLWLPLALCRYVSVTGDSGVLDESAPFLEGRALNPDEDSNYDQPGQSGESATLYEHGVRAILRGLRYGVHGLPLIGSGDWNDGMNMVGAQGKGESVWLGFFLYEVLTRFSELARLRNDLPFAERCLGEAASLRREIERSGWDGEWYRRAYFDDGTPLGSADNDECQIDAIPQSWSVLSGAGDPDRSRTAMAAVNRRLVLRDAALIQVLDPPFDTSALNPGYIKGYVPGVRENGGQYTHAAIWTVMAFAALGDSARAWELFGLINPVRHADSETAIATYKVEPYVVAADVYAVAPHTGRGGWTWYTGSAGWMYRLVLESLLGLQVSVDTLRIAPCIPADWTAFKLHYRYRSSVYHISVRQSRAPVAAFGISVDGVALAGNAVTMLDDHAEHAVEVRIQRADG